MVEKDGLRWHVCANKKLSNTTTNTTSTSKQDQTPNYFETTIIDQNQVSITWHRYDIITKLIGAG